MKSVTYSGECSAVCCNKGVDLTPLLRLFIEAPKLTIRFMTYD